ncbi:MAG: HYExAFE family protein [Pirellulaceae bacterium]|nr:HYExAFE family protein [Pirellulaceae bacterium]
MTRRQNHYEVAFETYLHRHGIAVLAVDETKRPSHYGQKLKNLDCVVFSQRDQIPWLVDVKGRQFTSSKRWLNWIKEEELTVFAEWEQLFGWPYKVLFVFAYHVIGSFSPVSKEQLFFSQGRYYAFVGIPLSSYQPHAKQVSESWQTVALPRERFCQLARPIHYFLEKREMTVA